MVLKTRVQGWDPIMIISQIVALQALHYLVLAFLAPPLLYLFSDPRALAFEGGAWNLGMIMDWREIAGQPTWDEIDRTARGSWNVWGGAWRGGHVVGQAGALDAPVKAPGWEGVEKLESWWDGHRLGTRDALGEVGVAGIPAKAMSIESWEWESARDPMRGWVLAVAWLLTTCMDVFFLYYLVRRPTHILDHSLTFLFIHLVLTTWYGSSFPTSVFFYLVMGACAVVMIVWAEHLCVRREMREGLGVKTLEEEAGIEVEGEALEEGEERASFLRTKRGAEEEEMEMSAVRRSSSHRH